MKMYPVLKLNLRAVIGLMLDISVSPESQDLNNSFDILFDCIYDTPQTDPHVVLTLFHMGSKLSLHIHGGADSCPFVSWLFLNQ